MANEKQSIAGSPLANTGTQNFTPLGTNSDGDGDWFLVLGAVLAHGLFLPLLERRP